jgi:hypothetical protein
MSPKRIVQQAIERGLDIIAITDHNSAENCGAARRAAESTALTVLGGMEIASSEEAHVLALFDREEPLEELQTKVYEALPRRSNDERLFGRQVIANEHDEVLGFNERLLITATSLSLDRLLAMIHTLGGLAIACHVDREAFSALSQLGFIPPDMPFDAIEFSSAVEKAGAQASYRFLNSFPWVSFSDAHHLDQVGKRTTTFTMERPAIDELRLALTAGSGREVFWV